MSVHDMQVNGMTYRVREEGQGEPVLLLHGFPETSHMWTWLMGELAGEGYQCVAPDMRGYSPGARPEDVDAYRYEEVGGDVFGFAKAVGWDRFHLVGHDWGALAGWCALAIDEEPVQSWTAMSVPHYRSFAEAVRDDPEEELYRGFLEAIRDDATIEGMNADDCAPLRAGAWGQNSPDQVEDYVSVFREPGALLAAVNYYRACDMHARGHDDPSFVFGPVSTPTLLLRGVNDPYVRDMSFDRAAPYMTGPYKLVELDAGHWLVQEKPEDVRDEILTHLKANAL